PLFDGTPEAEQLAFSPKAEAARAVQAATATTEQESMIASEAAVTGETLADLAALIVSKAEIYEAAIGPVSGLRRKYTNLILAETDPQQYEVVLQNALAEADTLITDPNLRVALGLTV
ncbi:MAG: hypothetical protein AAF562_14780, partial [Pseudomonadota bacterium]